MNATWTIGTIALCLVIAAVLAAWSARPLSEQTLRRKGTEFARENFVYVDPGATSVVDGFTRSDRRSTLLAYAGLFVVGAGLTGIDARMQDQWRGALWSVVIVFGILLMSLRSWRVHGETPGASVRVPVSAFAHPSLRIVSALCGAIGAGVTLWVVATPSPYADASTVVFAATPTVLAAVAEIWAHVLARHSQESSRLVAYLHDARRGGAIDGLFGAVPMLALFSLIWTLSDQDVSEVAMIPLSAGIGFALVAVAATKRSRTRFRRRLWPQLAAGEIVTSATT